jgi:hypothetical protein
MNRFNLLILLFALVPAPAFAVETRTAQGAATLNGQSNDLTLAGRAIIEAKRDAYANARKACASKVSRKSNWRITVDEGDEGFYAYTADAGVSAEFYCLK